MLFRLGESISEQLNRLEQCVDGIELNWGPIVISERIIHTYYMMKLLLMKVDLF
jgi:hypothetical protein